MQNDSVKFKIIFFLVISFGLFGLARTSSAATYQFSDCTESALQTAVSASYLVAGDIVTLPSCTIAVSSGVTITKPITVSGAAGGGSTISCQIAQCLVFNVNDSTPAGGASAPLWRATNINFTGGIYTGGSTAGGFIRITGTGNNWRIDNNTMPISNIDSGIIILGATADGLVYGLIDHNTFTSTTAVQHNAIYIAAGPALGLTKFGWDAWENSSFTWGSPAFVFIEDNTFTGAVTNGMWATDGDTGGRIVFRYNRVRNGSVQWHGFDSGSMRGFAGGEIYNNDFSATISTMPFAVHARAGSIAVHDNMFSNYASGVNLHTYRLIADDSLYQSACASGGLNCWPRADGTQWSMCNSNTTHYNFYGCSNSVQSYPSIPYMGDAYCDYKQGAGYACSEKFCNQHVEHRCQVDSDCPNSANGETCTRYIDADGTPPWPARDQVGTIPGGTISQKIQPVIGWQNAICRTLNCTPVVGAAISSPTIPSQYEGRDFFNCTDESDCNAKIAAYFSTISGTMSIGTAIYSQYTYPHPLTLTGSGDTTAPATPSGLSVQ